MHEVRPISDRGLITIGKVVWVFWILLGVLVDKLSELPRRLLRR